jgi:HEAT repeat protein
MTLAGRLRAATVEERRAAVAELVAGGDASEEELAALTDCLGHARKAVQRPAAEAFAALAARGVAVRDRLLATLAAPEARRRWGAAFALSLLGPVPAAALPVLVETLGSDDGDLRWAAARILPRAAERDATVALLRALVRTGNAPQRKMALYCLRDLDAREPAIEEEMLARLEDPDRDVRLAAIGALARVAVDRQRVARRLADVLVGDEPPVRRAAAAALGAVGSADPPIVAGLHAAAAGSDPALRRAAERALAALGV